MISVHGFLRRLGKVEKQCGCYINGSDLGNYCNNMGTVKACVGYNFEVPDDLPLGFA